MSSRDKKQFIWETWFVISVTIFVSILFIGTVENSKTFAPNYLYYLLISFVNVFATVLYGMRSY